MGDTKRCTKCGELKPANTDFFNREKANRDGLRNTCRECRKLYKRTYHAEHRAEESAYGKIWNEKNRERKKQYNKATRYKYAEKKQEYRESHREQERECRRKYYAVHREQSREYSRSYYITHREQTREQNRERCRRYHAEHRQEMRDGVRRYRHAHPDRKYAANRRHRAKYPEKHRAYRHNRRARELTAEGQYNGEDAQRQYRRQWGHCFWCSEPVGNTYHIDHVMPLSRGGSNWPENLVITCRKCNSKKCNKLPYTEWTPPNPLFPKG